MLEFLIYHPAPLYGVAAGLAVVLTSFAEHPTWIKLSLLLLIDWAAYNVLLGINGYAKAPIVIPIFDAIFALFTGSLVFLTRDRVAGAVFGLFVAVVALWWLAIWEHVETTYLCYLAANLIFLAQVLIVGGAGGFALASRFLERQLRARRRLARG